MQEEEALAQQQAELLARLQHWQGIKTAAGVFATEEALNLLVHAIMGNPSGMIEGALFGGIAALAAGYQAPKWLRSLRESLPHTEELEPLWLLTHRAAGQRSLLDRLLDRPLVVEDDEEDEEEDELEEEQADDNDGSEEAPSPVTPSKAQDGRWIPPQFRLEEVRSVVQDFNLRHCVYFGESEQGAIAVPLSDMYHVIDVSSSGKGKSNRFRLAMMQMVNHCETYYINPFAANVKAVKDERKIEVWKPIFDRLANKRPMKEGADIEALLISLVDEIAQRDEQEQQGDFTFLDHPIFVFVDELPEVFARCPDAIKHLDRIGRTGRQYCVFSWIASQTALVSEIGQSTAAQANYKTRIYGGGDKASSNRLMKGTLPQGAERTLQASGAGLTLMLADGVDGLAFVRAPLVTNEAMFAYFGLPPFRLEDWIKGNKPPTPTLLPIGYPDARQAPLSPFTLSPGDPHTHENARESPRESVKGERGERVKGPNEEDILTAIEALEEDQRPLTLNAIAKLAGLTWRQYDEIEEVAFYYGYDLERGKGRPSKEA